MRANELSIALLQCIQEAQEKRSIVDKQRPVKLDNKFAKVIYLFFSLFFCKYKKTHRCKKKLYKMFDIFKKSKKEKLLLKYNEIKEKAYRMSKVNRKKR